MESKRKLYNKPTTKKGKFKGAAMAVAAAALMAAALLTAHIVKGNERNSGENNGEPKTEQAGWQNQQDGDVVDIGPTNVNDGYTNEELHHDPTIDLLQAGIKEDEFAWKNNKITGDQITQISQMFARYYELSTKEDVLTPEEENELYRLGQEISRDHDIIQSIELRTIADGIADALDFTQDQNNYLASIKEVPSSSESVYRVVVAQNIDGEMHTNTIFNSSQTKGLLPLYKAVMNDGGDPLEAWISTVEISNGITPIIIDENGNLRVAEGQGYYTYHAEVGEDGETILVANPYEGDINPAGYNLQRTGTGYLSTGQSYVSWELHGGREIEGDEPGR